MAPSRASADDLEHISSTAVPGKQSTKEFPPGSKPDAFTELMSRKPPKASHTAPTHADAASARTVFAGRDGLAAYTKDPASFPASRVVYYNDKFTVINDLYPKASVHLLLLPRDPKKNVLHPTDAFDDVAFLEECRGELKNVRKIVAGELRRKFGRYSASDKPRLEALDSDDPPDVLPKGRDWEKEVISGIHANPSMSHLHVHVMSRDMVSECMKKSNHYLSFTTDFLVGLEQFPLAKDDYRRHYGHFPQDMLCWRCGKNFGNKMASLKKHLAEELEEWKKE